MTEAKPVALVTGGAKRVGRAIAKRLADADFRVAITYNYSEAEAQNLANAIGGLAIAADLAEPEKASADIFSAIHQHFGRLDLLVNNASVYLPATLAETDIKLMRTVEAVHVQSPLLLCQKFEPMLRASGGSIVNMVDLLAERPLPQYMAYCASKAGLANLTLGLARALAPQVTVNGIAPGVVKWPDDLPEEQRQKYLQRVPLGRPGTPEEVADLVHFLCTKGKYITGQIIRLDGGRSIT